MVGSFPEPISYDKNTLKACAEKLYETGITELLRSV